MVLIRNGKVVKTHPEIIKIEQRERGISSRLLLPEEGFPCFKRYTGLNEGVGGGGTYHNTILAAEQLALTLALSTHPTIEKLLREKVGSRSDIWNYNVSNLIDNQVLKGLKIMDLGCGPRPAFARVSRILGAQVYTVDIENPDFFEYYQDKKIDYESMKQSDKQNHIAMDLNREDSGRVLLDIAGREFDLVTEAHLTTYSHRCRDITTLLLKNRGIHYEAGASDIEIKIGEELIRYA